MALTPEASFTRTYPAVAESVRRARRAVTELAAGAGADRQQLESIRLAVSEAVTNAVRHAYADEPGMIHITAAIAGGQLTLLIADDGCGPQQPSRTPGLGWGLALIAAASDGFTIAQRADGGTEAWISFRVGRSQPTGYPGGSSAPATAPASSRFSTTT
jgi:serine/threonine-protein kinase RsbW